MTPAALTPAQQALLERRLRGRGSPDATVRSPDGAAAPAEGTDGGLRPLSAEQEQLYIHSLLSPGRRPYNEVASIVRTGPLDLAALNAALRALVARHEILRTTFRRRRQWVCQTVQPVPEFALQPVDVSDLPESRREHRARELVAAVAGEPYDLAAGPLLRPLLIRHSPTLHRLYLAMHHLIFDGVSLYRILLPELVELYDAAVAGREALLPPPVQYADYATEQASGALDRELREHLPYWRRRLADLPQLRLPFIERPDAADGTQSALPVQMIGFIVPAEVTAGLHRLAARERVTLFHIVAAAFAILLRDVTGDHEVAFATVADRRNRREWERMVGYCLTPVMLRLETPDGATVTGLASGARDEMLRALDHLLPYERLMRELRPAANGGAAGPLFHAMLVLEPPALPVPEGWALNLLDAELGSRVSTAKTALQIDLDERPDGRLVGRCSADTGALPGDLAPRVMDRFTTLLNEAAAAIV